MKPRCSGFPNRRLAENLSHLNLNAVGQYARRNYSKRLQIIRLLTGQALRGRAQQSCLKIGVHSIRLKMGFRSSNNVGKCFRINAALQSGRSAAW